jgi:hypothetical protein
VSGVTLTVLVTAPTPIIGGKTDLRGHLIHPYLTGRHINPEGRGGMGRNREGKGSGLRVEGRSAKKGDQGPTTNMHLQLMKADTIQQNQCTAVDQMWAPQDTCTSMVECITQKAKKVSVSYDTLLGVAPISYNGAQSYPPSPLPHLSSKP